MFLLFQYICVVHEVYVGCGADVDAAVRLLLFIIKLTVIYDYLWFFTIIIIIIIISSIILIIIIPLMLLSLCMEAALVRCFLVTVSAGQYLLQIRARPVAQPIALVLFMNYDYINM